MQKLLLSLLCSALFASLFGQDTLIMRNGDRIYGKVIEVGQTIDYKKETNPDGPTYKYKKEDVSFIRYKNGTTDTIAPKAPPLKGPNESLAKAKIELRRGQYLFNDKRLSESKVLKYLSKEATGHDLLLQVAIVRSYRKKELITGIVAGGLVVASAAAVVLQTLASIFDPYASSQTTGYEIGAGLLGTAALTGIYTITIKVKRKKAAQKMIDLYNHVE